LFSDYYTKCLNYSFIKLSEYYTKIDESLYYAIVVALYPYKRFTYFDEIWSKTTSSVASIQTAKALIQRLFDDYLKRIRAERESLTKLDTLFIHDNNKDKDKD
jgi:chromosome condensin MukBEF complex kleisin-like MukF subunit